MALILNIETSSPVCSVCLARDGQVLGYKEDRQGNSHARVLTVFIDELLKEQKTAYSQLEAVAVSAGPGSYTGLRIGVSTAKGLCYALNKPLIAVPTLLSLALGMQQKVNDTGAFYMPVIDARRMDVYTALFDILGKEVLITSTKTINKQLEDILVGFNKIYIAGNAMDKCKSVFTIGNFRFMEGIDCDARLLANTAELKFKKAEFENLAYFQPVYLKEFSAKTGNN